MTETIVVIDYGSGNLRSAQKALQKAASALNLSRNVVVSDRPDDVVAADRVVLPGVGAFRDCYAGLTRIDGMVDALASFRASERPFLGICVGMQLMAREGYEHGTHEGLGWIDSVVGPIKAGNPGLKIPHMGWNALNLSLAGTQHPLMDGVLPGEHAYFVHSYHMSGMPHGVCLASVDYGGPIVAAVASRAAVGTQFHPEKSQVLGQKILTNFLLWRP